MYRIIFLSILFALVLSSCALTQQQEPESEKISIRDAIELSAAAAPAAIIGEIEMVVQASAKSVDNIYLNSEDDYRDQRNLTVTIPKNLALDFKKQYGQFPDEYYKDKRISVTGEISRAKIYFYCADEESNKPRKSKKYYYQTHLKISSLDQIQLL